MLKLLLIIGLIAAAYYYYRAQELISERRKAELEQQDRARRNITDVEAEVIDITPPKQRR